MRFQKRLSRQIRRAQQKYKHQVDLLSTGVNSSLALTSTVIAIAADNPLIGATSSVQPRSKVVKVYMEISFVSTVAPPTGQIFHWNMQFIPQNAIPAVDPTAAGAATGKNYVFKTGTVQVQSNAPGKVFGYVKIPPKYSRLMNQDNLIFTWRTSLNNGATDGVIAKFIYQEIRG